ncbi:MAG: HD domain-containing protein [Spirochaetia bacterium]|nr:HD domain-containing protein [Spirochaetia bacterium]
MSEGDANALGDFLPCLRRFATSNEEAPLAIAILDAHFRFVHRNRRLREMMDLYEYPADRPFLESFSRSMPSSEISGFRTALTDPSTGHSWKGEIDHWTPETLRVSTVVRALPFFAPVTGGKKPVAFFLYFDDVTKQRKLDLRRILQALLKASLLKDKETGLHVERVNSYAGKMAQAIWRDARFPRVDAEFIEEIGFLASMHDVGKIGVRDDILNKEGPLLEGEWDEMRQHTINGGILLHSIYPNPMAREIALSHHERWNGKGYPYNLLDRMIPLAARVVTIADVYDALRMRRSYKPPFTHEEAAASIRRESGMLFDPDLVDVFLELEDEFERIYDSRADS